MKMVWRDNLWKTCQIKAKIGHLGSNKFRALNAGIVFHNHQSVFIFK